MTFTEKNTLTKQERLHENKRIDGLFASGSSFIAYPLRIVYLRKDREEAVPDVTILVSVSKRKFKRAVKRNRMKRLIREAYRLNKQPFYDICEKYNVALDIAFLYLKDELSDFAEIEKAMRKVATSLVEKLESDK